MYCSIKTIYACRDTLLQNNDTSIDGFITTVNNIHILWGCSQKYGNIKLVNMHRILHYKQENRIQARTQTKR